MVYKKDVAISVSSVEDDAHARKILARWVSQASGFRLAGECADAETAVQTLPGKKPDVVLMDINLPGMTGVEAVRKLKPALPGTQFVMLTVYEDADPIYASLAPGATRSLSNPTPPE